MLVLSRGGNAIKRTKRARRQQVILAPASEFLNSNFQKLRYDPRGFNRILRDLQRLRGRVYLRDGAIGREDLSADGRHESPIDPLSWHIVTLDQRGAVVACARFHVCGPSTRYEDLGVSRSSMAKSPKWGRYLRSAVESVVRRVRATRSHFVEAGGWALDESVRHSTEALRIVLGAFAWSELIGGATCVTTATFRNHSAEILQKIGGRPMRDKEMELPRYFDPQYDCDMQILTFETGRYAPRFRDAVLQRTEELAKTERICEFPIFRTYFPEVAAQAA